MINEKIFKQMTMNYNSTGIIQLHDKNNNLVGTPEILERLFDEVEEGICWNTNAVQRVVY